MPDEREAHVDAEILQVGLAEILGVRVVGLREGGEEKLHLLGLVFFVHVAHEAIVTAGDELRAGLDRMFAERFLEKFVQDPAVPDDVGLRLIFRPRQLSAG